LFFIQIAMELIQKCDLQSNGGTNTCMNCWMKQFSLLEGLSETELAILEKDRGTRIFKAGEVIFKAGEVSKGLLCLHTGKVKITKCGLLENDPIISLKKPVDFLGLEALVLEENYASTATALEDSAICILDKASFLQVVKGNAGLSMRVMRLLAQKTESANNRMLVLTQKHMRGRLADALLLLLKEYGTLADQITLNVELKRADLAAIANMTSANAIRILSLFVQEELIETHKRQIKIKDLKGLEKVSQLG